MDDLAIWSSFPEPLIAAKPVQKALDHLEEWPSLWCLPVSPENVNPSLAQIHHHASHINFSSSYSPSAPCVHQLQDLTHQVLGHSISEPFLAHNRFLSLISGQDLGVCPDYFIYAELFHVFITLKGSGSTTSTTNNFVR